MGKGGKVAARWGAGRSARRLKADCLRGIDVRRFAAENMLRPGAWAWVWRDPESGERRASIGIEGGADHLKLRYTVGGEPICTEVSIIKTACGFGGSRPWFACPRCRRRVAKLFMTGKRFACRHCLQLSYASQSEDACARAWRKQAGIEARLGPNWTRPKHMHQKTYERLLRGLEACAEARERWATSALVRIGWDLDLWRIASP